MSPLCFFPGGRWQYTVCSRVRRVRWQTKRSYGFSCAARCLKRQISCHNKHYIQLLQSRPCTGEVQTRHEFWNLYVTMLWSYHVVESSGCKHGRKRCSLLWQKWQNSSKISMDQLIRKEYPGFNLLIYIRKRVLCQGLPRCLRLCIDPCMARHAQSLNSSLHAWPQNLEAF